MRRVLRAILPFLPFAILLIGFFGWRWPAPAWKGQELHFALPDAKENDQDVEVFVLGDTGTGDDFQRSVAAAMNSYCKEHPMKAIIFLGDNFYPHGVQSVDDPQWKDKFHDIYNLDCLKNLPTYAVLGNHDYYGNPEAQIQYNGQGIPSWHMPHRFYDLRISKYLQFTMIDTKFLDFCGLSSFCTLDFLRSSLKQSDARYKVVVGHHPANSVSKKYPHTVQGRILESFLCGLTSSYISGHSHHLEHRVAEKCSMDMFVVGGGGADLYDLREKDEHTRYAQSHHGFMVLKAGARGLDYTLYDENLKVLYEVQRTDSNITARLGAPELL